MKKTYSNGTEHEIVARYAGETVSGKDFVEAEIGGDRVNIMPLGKPRQGRTHSYCYDGRSYGLLPSDVRQLVAEGEAAFAARMAARSPATIERIAVDRLYEQTDRLERADYCDPGAIVQARLAAEAADKAWREKYPAAARQRRAEALRARAQRMDMSATGALTHDADGWIPPAEQWRRHDERKAKAEALRQEAAELERGTRQ